MGIIQDKYHDNDNINVRVRVYKWCEKCGKELEEGSVSQFCCWDCKKEYYLELAQDTDDIVGRN